MNYFLAKTDPETYSIDDFAREGHTTWDGVRNPQAVQFIKAMQSGDQVLIYHSQGETAIVGLALVTSVPRPDPKEDPTKPKSWVVDMQFVKKLVAPVSLREIKASGQFDDWSLVRHSRLSTMSVPEGFIKWLEEEKQAL